MKSIYDTIQKELTELKTIYHKRVVDVFTLEASIHFERDNDFEFAWYGVRHPTSINRVTLTDLNFFMRNHKLGDDGPDWKLCNKRKNWESFTSDDEWLMLNRKELFG